MNAKIYKFSDFRGDQIERKVGFRNERYETFRGPRNAEEKHCGSTSLPDKGRCTFKNFPRTQTKGKTKSGGTFF